VVEDFIDPNDEGAMRADRASSFELMVVSSARAPGVGAKASGAGWPDWHMLTTGFASRLQG
jgi:hypothetical protein